MCARLSLIKRGFLGPVLLLCLTAGGGATAYIPPAWYLLRQLQAELTEVKALRAKGEVRVPGDGTGIPAVEPHTPGAVQLELLRPGRLRTVFLLNGKGRALLRNGAAERNLDELGTGTLPAECLALVPFMYEKHAQVLAALRELGIDPERVAYDRIGRTVAIVLGRSEGPRLWLDQGTRAFLLLKRGEYEVTWTYDAGLAGGLPFPRTIELRRAGRLLLTTVFTAVEQLRSLPPARFDPAAFDPASLTLDPATLR